MHDWPKFAIQIQTYLESSKTAWTLLVSSWRFPRPVIKLGGRGGLAHLKDLMAPEKHLFWEGTRGLGKAPPPEIVMRWWLFIGALLQFASVAMYWNCSEKRFCSPKYDFWIDFGKAQKIFYTRSLTIFYSPLINYDIVWPLPQTP